MTETHPSVDIEEFCLYTPPPCHVGFIMDGNRRFARREGIKIREAHKRGVKRSFDIISWCEQLGVEEVTIYAFSTENFDREEEEIRDIFEIITRELEEIAGDSFIHHRRVNFNPVGDLDLLPPSVRTALARVNHESDQYESFRLNFAVAYGGRNELLSTFRDILEEVDEGRLRPDEITDELIDRRLYDPRISDADLIIRTSGERRMSNFLPWRGWGAESVVNFVDCYAPEFELRDLIQSFDKYQSTT